MMREIDPSAPIPAPLEGGSLHLCVIDSGKIDRLRDYAASNFRTMVLYSRPSEFELEDSLYRPDGQVAIQNGQDPTVILPRRVGALSEQEGAS